MTFWQGPPEHVPAGKFKHLGCGYIMENASTINIRYLKFVCLLNFLQPGILTNLHGLWPITDHDSCSLVVRNYVDSCQKLLNCTLAFAKRRQIATLLSKIEQDCKGHMRLRCPKEWLVALPKWRWLAQSPGTSGISCERIRLTSSFSGTKIFQTNLQSTTNRHSTSHRPSGPS